MGRITLRLTIPAHERLLSLKESSGYTTINGLVNDILTNASDVSDSIRDLCLSQLPTEEEIKELRNLRNEINAIGKNLNQITKAYNKYGDQPEYKTIKDTQKVINRSSEIIDNYITAKLSLLKKL